MDRRRNTIIVGLFFMVSVLLTGIVHAEDLPELFTPYEHNNHVRTSVLPDTITVDMDFSLIAPNVNIRSAFKASLPDRKIILHKDWTEYRADGNYTWAGKVAGDVTESFSTRKPLDLSMGIGLTLYSDKLYNGLWSTEAIKT